MLAGSHLLRGTLCVYWHCISFALNVVWFDLSCVVAVSLEADFNTCFACASDAEPVRQTPVCPGRHSASNMLYLLLAASAAAWNRGGKSSCCSCYNPLFMLSCSPGPWTWEGIDLQSFPTPWKFTSLVTKWNRLLSWVGELWQHVILTLGWVTSPVPRFPTCDVWWHLQSRRWFLCWVFFWKEKGDK